MRDSSIPLGSPPYFRPVKNTLVLLPSHKSTCGLVYTALGNIPHTAYNLTYKGCVIIISRAGYVMQLLLIIMYAFDFT